MKTFFSVDIHNCYTDDSFIAAYGSSKSDYISVSKYIARAIPHFVYVSNDSVSSSITITSYFFSLISKVKS